MERPNRRREETIRVDPNTIVVVTYDPAVAASPATMTTFKKQDEIGMSAEKARKVAAALLPLIQAEGTAS
jgi:hypothetical protein